MVKLDVINVCQSKLNPFIFIVVEKSAEPKERKSLLSLKIPSISLPGFPNRKKDQNLSSQSGVAGLASMETLDENDKSADKKEDEMKNVSLEIDEVI